MASMAQEDVERLLGIHRNRPKREQAIDEAFKATITNDPEQWINNPGRFDFPGVDTPTAEKDRDIMEFNEGNLGFSELAERL